MTPRWLDDLDRLEKAATPGPWSASEMTMRLNEWNALNSNPGKDRLPIVRRGPDVVAICWGNEENGEEDKTQAEFVAALRNRLPQILRALRAAMEMREKNISDCDAGEDCGPCNNCGVCRWDAAMADAAPDATDTTEKGK